ncbi:MAG: hypothetical protein V1697_00905 [Candidatus Levyibacteriota bacterium]
MKKVLIYFIVFLFFSTASASAIETSRTQALEEQRAIMINKRAEIASRSVEIKENAKQKKIGTLQQRTIREIKRRITALNRILERIRKIKRLSDVQKNTLNSQIQEEIQKLTDLDNKIAQETDPAVIKEDAQLIIKSYRIYALFIPKIHILGASDAMQNATARLDEIAVRLEVKITEAEGIGEDVTDLEALLADLKEKTASANSQAGNARDLIIPLTQEGYPDNKTTLKEAKEMLSAGRKDIQVARQNAIKIIQILREFNIDTSDSTKSDDPIRYRQNQ